jgi:putative transposase
MNREAHVRFCEGPKAQFLRPTHPYIRITSGFCYLAAILDACSRKVVGYAISRTIDTNLALAALKSGLATRHPPAGCIFHTDR